MEILELIKSDFEGALKILTSEDKKKVLEYKDEYRGGRKISGRNQIGKKEDKIIGKGENRKTVTLNRLKFAYQKKIVKTAVAFLVGSPIKLTPSDDTDSAQKLLKVWRDLRLNSLIKKFAEAVKSETEASILFYIKEAPEGSENKFVIKAKLQTSDNGNFYPHFDSYGDLDAFTWEFEGVDETGKAVPEVWIWTAETTYKYQKLSSGWVSTDTLPNLFKKIPIVYMTQREPEWFDVKEMIDRVEVAKSGFTDTNDYSGNPILKLFGNVKSMPDKEDTGKAIRIDQTYEDGKLVKSGDVEYLTNPNAPESWRLEFEMLNSFIYSHTNTPDLSLDNLKGMSQVSGVALKLMFLDPILKAKESEGDYDIVVDRILNVLKAGLKEVVDTSVDFEGLEINKEFSSILPDNLLERIQMLSEATAGMPTMSQESAVAMNPLTKKGEFEKVKKESSQQLGETVI